MLALDRPTQIALLCGVEAVALVLLIVVLVRQWWRNRR